jgi:hypothetical protein
MSFRQFSIFALMGLLNLSLACLSSSSANKDDPQPPTTAELRRKDSDLRLNDRFVATYLERFGYLKHKADKSLSSGEMAAAVKTFQEFIGIPATGKTDLPTTDAMVRKRCANADFSRTSGSNKIWEKTTLAWNVTDFPKGFVPVDVRELIKQAFSAWEIVISMDFTEVDSAQKADIVFRFTEDKKDELHELAIASASPPIKSEIRLNKNEHWATFQRQRENQVDLFLVLVHSIGHALGLGHSPDRKSVMFPIFERSNGEELPVINSDDVERLRSIYDTSSTDGDVVDGQQENDGQTTENEQPSQCPTSLWSAGQAPNGDLYVFADSNCWHFRNRSQMGGPAKITKVFPGSPDYVDVAVGTENWLVLLKERTLYAYSQDEVTGKFKLVNGFPRALHGRVLFYPEAAFPLANGSTIFIRDEVFATYNMEDNVPSMLNDKNVFFPNLPEDLRSGVPQVRGSDNLYWMLTGNTAYEYDSRIQQVIGAQPVAKFLGCGNKQTTRKTT